MNGIHGNHHAAANRGLNPGCLMHWNRLLGWLRCTSVLLLENKGLIDGVRYVSLIPEERNFFEGFFSLRTGTKVKFTWRELPPVIF